MAQKFWYIFLDLCEFFQILETHDLFFFENDIFKTKSKKNLKKIGYVFLDRYFHIKIMEDIWDITTRP